MADSDVGARGSSSVTYTGGSGLGAAAVQALIDGDDDVVDGRTFRAALRRTRNLAAAASVVIAASNAAGEIPGAPSLPASLPGSKLTVTVAGGADAKHSFALSALLAEPPASPGDQLSASSAIAFGDGGDRLYVARRANGELLFGADNIGDYAVTIDVEEIDLRPQALATNDDAWPASKLPLASGSASGIIDSDTYDRIQSSLDGAHLSSTPKLNEAQLEDADDFYLEDESVSSGSKLRKIQTSELDRRWGRTAIDARIAAYGRAFTAGDEAKLDAIEAGATADQTAAEIRDALAGLNGADRLDASAIKDLPQESGLDEAAVDARVKALVEDWAEVGGGRVPAARLPRALQDLAGAIDEPLWAGHLTLSGISDMPQAARPAAIPGDLDWGRTEFEVSPARANAWIVFRILKTEKADLSVWRLRVTETDTPDAVVAGADWIFLADAPGQDRWAYYIHQFAILGEGAEVRIEKYTPLEFDERKVLIPGVAKRTVTAHWDMVNGVDDQDHEAAVGVTRSLSIPAGDYAATAAIFGEIEVGPGSVAQYSIDQTLVDRRFDRQHLRDQAAYDGQPGNAGNGLLVSSFAVYRLNAGAREGKAFTFEVRAGMIAGEEAMWWRSESDHLAGIAVAGTLRFDLHVDVTRF